MLLILDGSFGETDLDPPIGCPSQKASQPIKVLLDQMQLYKKNDNPINSKESEPRSNSDSSTTNSEGKLQAVTAVPVQQQVKKKKVVAKDVGASDTSDNGDGMDPTLIHCYHLQIVMSCTVPFSIMLEVANQCKGSQSIKMIQSDIPWTSLWEHLARLLDIYPSSLQAQYCLSTQLKAFPLDLQTENDLKMMVILVQPLIVPPLLATGRRSTQKMKPITIHIFSKDKVVAVPDKVCYSQVISNAHFSLNKLEVR